MPQIGQYKVGGGEFVPPGPLGWIKELDQCSEGYELRRLPACLSVCLSAFSQTYVALCLKYDLFRDVPKHK